MQYERNVFESMNKSQDNKSLFFLALLGEFTYSSNYAWKIIHSIWKSFFCFHLNFKNKFSQLDPHGTVKFVRNYRRRSLHKNLATFRKLIFWSELKVYMSALNFDGLRVYFLERKNMKDNHSSMLLENNSMIDDEAKIIPTTQRLRKNKIFKLKIS